MSAQQLDAKSRAWRTLAQGLALDVLVAVVMVLASSIGDLQWTTAWFSALGLLIAKSAVHAAVAYLARIFVPPPT